MTLHQYIDTINQRFMPGMATAQTFRVDLQQLIEGIVPEINATLLPKRQSCGAPDYLLTKGDIPIGYIVATDIGDKDLGGLQKTGNKEQFDLYMAALENLIITDFLDFYLYRDGQPVTTVAIGEITDEGIKARPHNFSSFEIMILDFSTPLGKTSKSLKKQTEMNFDEILSYEEGFKMDEFFNVYTTEIATGRDSIFTDYTINLQKQASFNTVKHLIKDNIALSFGLQQSRFNFQHILVANCLVESGILSFQTNEKGFLFPLYLYPETGLQQAIAHTTQRSPNLNPELVRQIAEGLEMIFVPEKEGEGNVCLAHAAEVRPEYRSDFAPIDLLDYLYAVLHSPTYREKYKKFMKIDFPRVPYPKDIAVFWKLVELGGEIRQVHLLESPIVYSYLTQFPIGGDNEVVKPIYREGKVYINDTQYFDQVPDLAWNFYIGDYQPAQQWLQDRKGRKLEFEDILHYQKIIVALTETDRLMKEIDKINIL